MIDVEIETWCSKKRKVEVLSLNCEERDCLGDIVSGIATMCSEEKMCSKGVLCMLNLRIQTHKRIGFWMRLAFAPSGSR